MKNGFTLVELLTVLAIIFVLTLISFPFYRTAQKKYILENAAQKLVQDMRKVQEMAMASKRPQGAASNFRGVYGIKLERNSSSYILFADLNNNQTYNSGEEVEIVSLEQNLQISNLSPASPLTIVFIPPDPRVLINPTSSLATIVIELTGTESPSSYQKTIRINQAGLIYVE